MLKKQKTKHETAKDDFQTKMFLLSIICAHTPLKLLLNKIFKKKQQFMKLKIIPFKAPKCTNQQIKCKIHCLIINKC